MYTSLSPQFSWLVHANGEIWKPTDNDELHHEFIGVIRPDYFKWSLSGICSQLGEDLGILSVSYTPGMGDYLFVCLDCIANAFVL